jgi:hypothetical protein
LVTDECAKPDILFIVNCFFQILLPVPYTGFRAVRAGLLTDTYLEIHHIQHLKERYATLGHDTEALERVRTFIEETTRHKKGSIYTILSRSIAPEIWGHEDVKKALLLMLAGAPTKITNDGMKIRGEQEATFLFMFSDSHCVLLTPLLVCVLSFQATSIFASWVTPVLPSLSF